MVGGGGGGDTGGNSELKEGDDRGFFLVEKFGKYLFVVPFFVGEGGGLGSWGVWYLHVKQSETCCRTTHVCRPVLVASSLPGPNCSKGG